MFVCPACANAMGLQRDIILDTCGARVSNFLSCTCCPLVSELDADGILIDLSGTVHITHLEEFAAMPRLMGALSPLRRRES